MPIFARKAGLDERVVVEAEMRAALARSQGAARKVLVIDRGGLGDAIHLLPALDLVRQNYVCASLHVMIGHQGLFEQLTPWIARAWPALAPAVFDNRELYRALRGEDFDAVFALSWRGSAIVAAGVSGARLKLGRRGPPDKPWWWQSLLLSHVVEYPLRTEPMWYQKWMCLRRAGLLGGPARFDVRLKPEWSFECRLQPADRKSYIHVAPFTAVAGRDLPLEQMVELLEGLAKIYPRMALSCDCTAAQSMRLRELVARLSFVPWRVYAGSLQLHQLVALIENARLHLGGDSGGLHVARLVDTPSVSWFKIAFGNRHWAPTEAEIAHRVIYSADRRQDALYGIRTAELLGLARQAVAPRPAPSLIPAG